MVQYRTTKTGSGATDEDAIRPDVDLVGADWAVLIETETEFTFACRTDAAKHTEIRQTATVVDDKADEPVYADSREAGAKQASQTRGL